MRKRGRPALNDDAVLRAAAMRLAKGEALKPRSAIAQSLPKQSPTYSSNSTIRRVQRKWRERGEALLAEAQAVLRRQEEERTKLARQVDRERNGYLADVANPYLTSVVQSVRDFTTWFGLEEMLRPTVTPLLEELQRAALMREAILEESITERVRRELATEDRRRMEMLTLLDPFGTQGRS